MPIGAVAPSAQQRDVGSILDGYCFLILVRREVATGMAMVSSSETRQTLAAVKVHPVQEPFSPFPRRDQHVSSKAKNRNGNIERRGKTPVPSFSLTAEGESRPSRPDVLFRIMFWKKTHPPKVRLD